jgi:hypothetical protein
MPSLEDPELQAQLQTVIMAVVSLLATVLLGLLAWASAAVKRWLSAKADHAVAHAAATKVFNVTEGLVREAEQTLVKEAKAATEDGKLTKEDAIRIRDEVVKRAVEHLGANGLGSLQRAFGHNGDKGPTMMERMLRTAIEARVSEQKEAANGG